MRGSLSRVATDDAKVSSCRIGMRVLTARRNAAPPGNAVYTYTKSSPPSCGLVRCDTVVSEQPSAQAGNAPCASAPVLYARAALERDTWGDRLSRQVAYDPSNSISLDDRFADLYGAEGIGINMAGFLARERP